ncbi:MAG: MBL fold metallo-hydrolase [Lentisphaeria bacterium]|nr:MBL fold metallo-hydrolase [Lentisphaeria bacterium]
MILEFLGTGTSQGVPEILCDCDVCTSDSPYDKRLRCSLALYDEHHNYIIDITPDFRQQMLRSPKYRLDAILLTHLHADHFLGMDDTRKYVRLMEKDIPLYIPQHMERSFRKVFNYTLGKKVPGLYRPRFELIPIKDQKTILLEPFKVTPLPVQHGYYHTLGYLIEANNTKVAYLTDTKRICPPTEKYLVDVDYMIVDALWDDGKNHTGHMNLEEAVSLIQTYKPKQAYLTHITHFMGKHEEKNATLPKNIQLAFDGQKIHF